MPGRESLRRTQFGRETTPGTREPATMIWRGPSNTLDDMREMVEPVEQVGRFSGTDRMYTPKEMANLSLAQTEATYEQLQYPLVMAYGAPFEGVLSGSAVVFESPLPNTAAPGSVPFTVETGDDFQAEFSTYVVATRVQFSGVGGEATRITADLIGRTVAPMPGGTFTAGISLLPVEEVLTSKMRVWIDDITGTFGTNIVSNQVLGYEINIVSTWEPKFTLDGSLTYSYPLLVDVMVDGRITFEHDTQGTLEKTNWRNILARKLRLEVTGGTIENGTAFTEKTLRFDLPIKWRKFDALTSQNGNDTINATFMSKYNEANDVIGTITLAIPESTYNGTVLA